MWLPAIALLGKHPTATAKGVLVELAGPLMLAQLPQIVGEVVGRAQGVGVVLAEHPAAVGEGVLVELAGLCILPQRPQIESEVVGRFQGVGVVGAEHTTTLGERPFEQGRAAPGSPRVCR